MSCNTKDEVRESITFLHLPREIRDIIYETALVRGRIPIECAVANLPSSRPRSNYGPTFCGELKALYSLKAPRGSRRLWSLPAFDIDLEGVKSENDPHLVHMTYQLAASHASSRVYGIELNLLQANKQIYHEASEVFYSKNVFSFTADYRIPTAFAFLCDRPPSSLSSIHSLELALTEDNNMRGTTPAHYPIVRRASDSLVLQYAYHHFTDLCTLLSTTRMNLRKLYLIIETLCSRTGPAPRSVPDAITWEDRRTYAPRPWLASWISPLLKVNGLDAIEAYWIFDRPRLQRMGETFSAMRQEMLVEKHGKESTDRKDSIIGTGLHFEMLHEKDDNDNTRVQYAPPLYSPVWQEYDFCAGSIRPLKHEQHSLAANGRTVQHEHVQKILSMAEGAYVCRSNLHRA